MRKIIFFLCFLVLLSNCKDNKETLKDKVLVDVVIENPGFGLLEYINLQRFTYLDNQKMVPNMEGRIKDTLKISHNGIYLMKFMNSSLLFYTEPGKQLNFKTKSNEFQNSLTFSGDYQKENEFLNFTNRKLRDTVNFFFKDIYKKSEQDAINNYYKSLKIVDEIVKNEAKDLKHEVVQFVKLQTINELHFKLNQYPILHKIHTKDIQYTPSKTFQTMLDSIKNEPILDQALKSNPNYRKVILTRFTEKFTKIIEDKNYKGNRKSPFFIMKSVLSKEKLSQYQRDMILATFAQQFDYKSENPFLSEVRDSANIYIKTPEIKSELEALYHVIKGIDINTDVSNLVMINQKMKETSLKSLQGKYTMLFFWTGFSMVAKMDVDAITNIKKKYPKLTVAMISMDKKQQWKPFLNKYKLYEHQYVAPQGKDSELAKKLYIGNDLPQIIILDKKSRVIAKNDGMINNPKTITILDSISKL